MGSFASHGSCVGGASPKNITGVLPCAHLSVKLPHPIQDNRRIPRSSRSLDQSIQYEQIGQGQLLEAHRRPLSIAQLFSPERAAVPTTRLLVRRPVSAVDDSYFLGQSSRRNTFAVSTNPQNTNQRLAHGRHSVRPTTPSAGWLPAVQRQACLDGGGQCPQIQSLPAAPDSFFKTGTLS